MVWYFEDGGVVLLREFRGSLKMVMWYVVLFLKWYILICIYNGECKSASFILLFINVIFCFFIFFELIGSTRCGVGGKTVN